MNSGGNRLLKRQVSRLRRMKAVEEKFRNMGIQAVEGLMSTIQVKPLDLVDQFGLPIQDFEEDEAYKGSEMQPAVSELDPMECEKF